MYIATGNNFRIIKKKIREVDGRPIYRNILEVTCDCGHVFESNISLDVDGKPKINCPSCS